jgi:Tol biopolymer transport system component
MRRDQKLGVLFSLAGIILLAATLIYPRFRKYAEGIQNSNWSKQGEWIVFACTPRDAFVESSLYIVRPNGGKVQRLTNDRIVAASPTWSPDGEEIAFATTIGTGLYKLKRGATKLTPLTNSNPSVFDYYPAWSPDGQWIAFVSRHLLEGTVLFRVKADGSVQEPLITEELSGPLSWSPDGQWIAFSSLQDNAHEWGIHTAHFDGSDVRSVTTMPGESPAWSPDGKQIAFVTGNIFLVQENGSEMKQITNLPGVVGFQAWSPDGQWIVFTYQEGKFTQLFKTRKDGSDLQQITHMNCNAMMPDWIKMPEGG